MTGFIIPLSLSVLIGTGLIPPKQEESDRTGLRCIVSLAEAAGLARHDAERISLAIASASVTQTEEFLSVLGAIAYVESRFRTSRSSRAGAVGILQVMRVAEQHVLSTPEYQEHFRVIPVSSGSRYTAIPLSLSDLDYNVKIGSRYLALALDVGDGSWVDALTMYNGGYKALTRLRQGDRVNLETSQYVLQVLHLAHTCGRRDQ